VHRDICVRLDLALLTFLGALFVGLSLGLLGSGGSMFTVPILVYVLGETPKLAITASLAIVGIIALVGAASYAHRRLVAWRYVLYFGIPGTITTYAGVWISHRFSGAAQLIVFAVVMFLASFTMLRSAPPSDGRPPQRHLAWLLATGAGVGLITGFVGVGGGFLFVPALVILGGLPMHLAVGTSLTVIALNCASGLIGHMSQSTGANLALPWDQIAVFAIIGVAGSLAGQHVGRRLAHERLRRSFGVMLIAMSCFVLWQTLPQVV
jgi:uncharacterized protein